MEEIQCIVKNKVIIYFTGIKKKKKKLFHVFLGVD